MTIKTQRVRCLGQYASGHFICQVMPAGSVYMFNESDYAKVDFYPPDGCEFDLTVEEIENRDYVPAGELRIEMPNNGETKVIPHFGLSTAVAMIVGVANVTTPRR